MNVTVYIEVVGPEAVLDTLEELGGTTVIRRWRSGAPRQLASAAAKQTSSVW